MPHGVVGMDHFIDTAANDLSRARTVGLNQLTPSPFPVLVVGTTSTHRFFFANSGAIEAWSGAADYSLRVTIADAFLGPVEGVWTLAVGAGTPQSIPYDIDAAGLMSLLNNTNTVTNEGGVFVEQIGTKRFIIAHNEVGTVAGLTVDGALLVPDCTARVSVLTEGNADTRQLVSLELRRNLPLQDTGWQPISMPYAGWAGTLSLDTAAAMELIKMRGVERGGVIECPTLITVEVLDSNQNPTAYFQATVILRALNYAVASSSSMQQAFFTKPNVVGLASNTANATLLGGLSTANNEYPIGGTLQCLFSPSITAQFIRKSSTANQNVPWIVRPYDYNSNSNPYQWVLDEVRQYSQPCAFDADTDKWHFLATQGNTNAVSVGADQTGFSLPA